ncbi:MAG: amino acid/polyamine transporter I [Benniella sp.]|nr:MAG: amino acid/polyamine transporter I [Benniella sp.]
MKEVKEAKIDRSEQRLRELGYKQELKRELTSFTNFSVSFSVVSILTGLTSLYGTALNSGGPAVIIWGWVFVSAMSMCVAASMAEICSSYPTSGGLYYWSSKLAGRHGPFYAWVTGWWNLLGQFGCTAGIDFGLAILFCSVVSFKTGWEFERWHVVLVYFLILIIHGLINTFLVKLMAIMNTISVWVHIGGVLIILITLLVKTENKASASFVFTGFINNTGWSSSVYVVLLGLLQSQFTMTGYDASAHMTEETKNADVAGPVGILMAVGVSFVAGLGYLLALTFGIQDIDRVLSTTIGSPITQIFLDSVGENGALLLLIILLLAQFFCGNASITANSRMIYAFSRDGAMPGSKYLHRIHPTLKSPVWGIWLSCFVSALLGLLYLADQVAFSAITSIATIGLYISYGLPTFCRLVYARDSFETGPVSLGRLSIPIGIISCIWIVIITVLFVLPTLSPVDAKNMNYTVVIVAASAIYIFGNWYFSARHWFKGPVSNIDLEDNGNDFVAGSMNKQEVEEVVGADKAEYEIK